MCKWRLTRSASACAHLPSSSSPRSSASSSPSGRGRCRCRCLPLLLLFVMSSLAAPRQEHGRDLPLLEATNASSAAAAAAAASSFPASAGRHVRSYDHLRGDVRWRKLYSHNKFFLQIGQDGSVKGTKKDNCPYMPRRGEDTWGGGRVGAAAAAAVSDSSLSPEVGAKELVVISALLKKGRREALCTRSEALSPVGRSKGWNVAFRCGGRGVGSRPC
ncbi:Fibroblast growth factor 10 [Varanus komodoensis]|nr:Fibroblast growth factor 10 [Varanus komodoensis]